MKYAVAFLIVAAFLYIFARRKGQAVASAAQPMAPAPSDASGINKWRRSPLGGWTAPGFFTPQPVRGPDGKITYAL